MMKIVAATNTSHLQAIEKLATTIWTEHYSPIIGAKQVSYMLAKFQSLTAMQQQINEGYEYFMAVDSNNELIGYMSIQVRNELLFLSKIYLDSSQRSLGYGQQLLNFAVKLAQQKACIAIELTVNKYNTATIAFYHKYGFVTIKEAVFDIGEGYVMDDYVLQFKL